MKKLLFFFLAGSMISIFCMPVLAAEEKTIETEDTGNVSAEKIDACVVKPVDDLLIDSDIEPTAEELMDQIEYYNTELTRSQEERAGLEKDLQEQIIVVGECNNVAESAKAEYEEFLDNLDENMDEYRAELIRSCVSSPLRKTDEYGNLVERVQKIINTKEYFTELAAEYEDAYNKAAADAAEETRTQKQIEKKIAADAAYQNELTEAKDRSKDKYNEIKAEEEAAAAEAEAASEAEKEAVKTAQKDIEDTAAISGKIAVVEAAEPTEGTVSPDDASYEADQGNNTQENGWREGESFDSAAFYAKFGYTDSGYPLNKTNGVVYYNGHKETYYSERILPGVGLNIPGRYTDEQGLVRDGDGYICVASSDLEKGTTIQTSLGLAKIYDSGCESGDIDIYVNW